MKIMTELSDTNPRMTEMQKWVDSEFDAKRLQQEHQILLQSV
jgi:hypothetical protein